MGVNVQDSFTTLAANLLCCRISDVSPKYLGLPMGVKLRSLLTWKIVIDTLR